jgi:hypothetical protein
MRWPVLELKNFDPYARLKAARLEIFITWISDLRPSYHSFERSLPLVIPSLSHKEYQRAPVVY